MFFLPFPSSTSPERHVIPSSEDSLPAPGCSFDLVLNRHGRLNLPETARVLEPDGVLLTQQVDTDNDREFNTALNIPPAPTTTAYSSAEELRASCRSAGLQVEKVAEALIRTRFLDVGAVVFQLRAVSRQAPGFDVVHHRRALRRIHEQIVRSGSFDVRSHRLFLCAHLPQQNAHRTPA